MAILAQTPSPSIATTSSATPQASLQAATGDPNSRTIAIATIVIAIATVIYVVATILLWWTTKQSVDITRQAFEAAQRPYIGATVAKRNDYPSPSSPSGPERIEFSIDYTNAGTVHAHDVRSSLLIIIDGNFLPRKDKEEEDSLALLPRQTISQTAILHEAQDLAAIKGASTLSLLLKCTYKGPSEKQYSYQQRYVQDRVSGHFAAVKTTIT